MPYSLENQITVEKTPNYFVDWEVPERIYNFNSSIKLILIVRNPIDRAVSDYVQLKVKLLKFSVSCIIRVCRIAFQLMYTMLANCTFRLT